MKVRPYNDGTPFGMLILEAENVTERAILNTFLSPSSRPNDVKGKWEFCIHGYGWSCDDKDNCPDHLSIGWRKLK